jgi:ATP-dependent Clp protease ATP-binding subunit ClpC
MSALSVAAELAWKVAAAEAARAGHPQIQNGHLLLGLCSLEKLLAVEDEKALAPDVVTAVRREADRVDGALARAKLESTPLRRRMRERLGRGDYVHGDRPVSRSASCKETFYRAALLAGSGEVTCLHLLAALAQDPDPAVSRPIRELGASLDDLKEQALLVAREAPVPVVGKIEGGKAQAAGAGTPELDRHGRDLTALAARGRLAPVVGRRAELLQLLQTLARASRNNPVLVGSPGVGKTAIVEALAVRASDGKDALLAGKRIVELSPAGLLAGTKHRGDLEERVGRILAEARAHPEIILFLDELHAMVGAGETSSGGGDLADLLKPALARGDLRLIGATTLDAYRRHVESDPALESRFDKIVIEEPTRDEALEILRDLAPRWEKHHGVTIDDEALQAAVDLSLRFDHDHRLPDKAIDLVDKAAARTRAPVRSGRVPEDTAVEEPAPAFVDRVTERAVALVLAERMHLPADLVAEVLPGAGRPRVLDLEAHLRERILGQDEAIARVCRRLRLAHSGTRDPGRPLGVLLFLGPTGVGKTETARLIASYLFGGPEALARFDMSEYMEEHSVARLIGAPPGDAGRPEDGLLAARLRARPHGVVLLDEVEKAHPRVFDVFLQAFDAGRLTDGQGRVADARHAIFVMTSKLGTSPARERPGLAARDAGEERSEVSALEEVRRFFRPELLSRIDEQVVFRALGPEDAARIVKPLLQDIVDSVRRQHGVVLDVEPAAEAFIAQAGFDPARGVREVRRAVERLVQAPLSNLILEGKIRKHPAWTVAYDEGGVYLIPAPRG